MAENFLEKAFKLQIYQHTLIVLLSFIGLATGWIDKHVWQVIALAAIGGALVDKYIASTKVDTKQAP